MLKAQTPAEPPAGMKFEVIGVTTGSGSKSQAADSAGLVLDAVPAVPEAAVAPENAGESIGSPAAANQSATPAAGAGGKKTPEEEKNRTEQSRLTAALEQWHAQTLENYNYRISALADPFMPIKEVRGRQELIDEIDPAVEAALPPILRLELNQLRLVAITVLSDRQGGALASFEDGAGASYILRQGDRIGRRKGVISKITPTSVTVEEPPRSLDQPPTITEIKLSPLNTDGLIRTGSTVP